MTGREDTDNMKRMLTISMDMSIFGQNYFGGKNWGGGLRGLDKNTGQKWPHQGGGLLREVDISGYVTFGTRRSGLVREVVLLRGRVSLYNSLSYTKAISNRSLGISTTSTFV